MTTVGRDERIWLIYCFSGPEWGGVERVVVFDLWGEQMPAYQQPGKESIARLEAAYPRHLWHEWISPEQCRCGAALSNHPPPGDAPLRGQPKASEQQ